MDAGQPCPAIAGYDVRVVRREAFRVAGYTRTVPPGPDDTATIVRFCDEVIGDGRLERLKACSPVPPWVLGLGSWDPECPKHGQRYTICIEETTHADFRRLPEKDCPFTKRIGASDWLCFKMTRADYPKRFWQDNPYRMLKTLGYRFHAGTGDYSVGLHFEAYPPEYDDSPNARMEFWITVIGPDGTAAGAAARTEERRA